MDRDGLRAAVAFLVAFTLGPLLQSQGLERIPGNLDDARLNNYLLENLWLFLTGHSDSLWHLPFFSPFPYVLGFSESLFGASPVYLLARAVTGQPDTAFQLWYLASYVANYAAAYCVLRRFGRSADAACLGALVFAFALPVSGQTLHAQLAYRFAVPFALGAFAEFLEGRDWRRALAAAAWLTWQFYCNLYLGVFTLLFLGCATAAHFIRHRALREELATFARSWRALAPAAQRQFVLACALLLSLLALLFYPYWRVAQLYHMTRTVEEIAPYLPRLQSYFMSDASWLWSTTSQFLPDVPWRWEHQLFVGALPLLLAVAGATLARGRGLAGFAPIAGALPIMLALTLSVDGASLWLLLARLPLFSGLRAIARVDLVLLFPVAYLCAVAVDASQLRRAWIAVAFTLMLVEFSAVSPYWTEKQAWRDRLAARVADVPAHLPAGSILFFAQDDAWGQSAELDAMWAARARGFATLNGYSGFFPPHFRQTFGADCSELPNRIRAYRDYVASSGGGAAAAALTSRIVPIGFGNCGWARGSSGAVISPAD